MSTYLLTWNPKKSKLTWTEKESQSLAKNKNVTFSWSCGRTKAIRKGGRIFLLRQGHQMRGLIGAGTCIRSTYEGKHWDKQRSNIPALYIDVRWKHFSTDPLIPRPDLDKGKYSQVHWNTQQSGIKIPDDIGMQLEKKLMAAAEKKVVVSPNEVHDQGKLPEGATRWVLVNTYERNPKARQRCLNHYGYMCMVCGIDLGEIYGAVAAGYIHVHHLRPLSKLKKSYTVNPVRDLCPVCPNCHAIIHLKDPPYSIRAIREMLEEQLSGS